MADNLRVENPGRSAVSTDSRAVSDSASQAATEGGIPVGRGPTFSAFVDFARSRGVSADESQLRTIYERKIAESQRRDELQTSSREHGVRTGRESIDRSGDDATSIGRVLGSAAGGLGTLDVAGLAVADRQRVSSDPTAGPVLPPVNTAQIDADGARSFLGRTKAFHTGSEIGEAANGSSSGDAMHFNWDAFFMLFIMKQEEDYQAWRSAMKDLRAAESRSGLGGGETRTRRTP